MIKTLVRTLETIQTSTICSNPNISKPIFSYGSYSPFAEAVLILGIMSKVNYLVDSTIILIESIKSTYPQISDSVFMDYGHMILTKLLREFFFIRIKFIERSGCTHPKNGRTIFKNIIDIATTGAVRIGFVMQIAGEISGSRIQTANAASHRTNPQHATSIDHQRSYDITANAGWVFWIIPKTVKTSLGHIHAIQSTPISS